LTNQGTKTLTHTALRSNYNLGLNLCILFVVGLLLVLNDLHLHLLDVLVEDFQILCVVPDPQIENGSNGNKDSCGEVESVPKETSFIDRYLSIIY